MKRIIGVILAVSMIGMVCMFTGCAKVVSQEEFTANVMVVDVNFRAQTMTPVKSGQTTIFITNPADYDTIVEYAGVEYEIDTAAAYRVAKNNIGKMVLANIEKTRYDDGDVKIVVKGFVEED